MEQALEEQYESLRTSILHSHTIDSAWTHFVSTVHEAAQPFLTVGQKTAEQSSAASELSSLLLQRRGLKDSNDDAEDVTFRIVLLSRRVRKLKEAADKQKTEQLVNYIH